MANERIINKWVYPMDSSATPYNETNFNVQVEKLCQDEIDQLQAMENNNNNSSLGQKSAKIKSTFGPVRNCLRIAKCNVVGDASVGKTCLINRFGYDVFDSKSKATIGVDFDVQKFSVLSRPFTLQIWDTAGDDRFRSITRAYYRGSHAAMIVFDLTLIKSFQNASFWYEEIMDSTCPSGNDYCTDHKRSSATNHSGPFLFLVGTKMDLVTEDTIAFYKQEGAKLANRFGAEFWMVSSNTGENVTQLFHRVVCLCFDQYILRELRLLKQEKNKNAQKQTKTGSKRSTAIESNNSVLYSTQNGGQVDILCDKNDQKKNNDNATSSIANWWLQWFGKSGKIQRRVRTVMNNGNKVNNVENGNGGDSIEKQISNKWRCFCFTCSVSMD